LKDEISIPSEERISLYRSFNSYLRETYGERVQKISIDAGFTCPNRDGTKAVGGCIYCNNDSFNFSPAVSVRDQIAIGIEKAKRRYGARKFLAYFQAYSNTYGSPDHLYDVYSTIYDFPEVAGLSIGTRPDCVPDPVLDLVQKFKRSHEVWVEYGLESSNDDSLRKINRAHTFADFKDAVLRTAGRGIKVATHIIVGFPWETEDVMLQTARDIASLPVNAIKIHNLHVVKDTALEVMYRRAEFPLMSLEDYARVTAQILEILPRQMIIQRLTAECPPELLIAPDWCNNKREIVAAIEQELRSHNSYQGKNH